MKRVEDVWKEVCGEDGANTSLAKAANEIALWQDTCVLSGGVLREFIRKLQEEGYPASDCISVARGHIYHLCLHHTIASVPQ